MKKNFLLFLSFFMLLSGCKSLIHQNNVNQVSQKVLAVVEKEEIPEYFIPRDIKIVSIGDSLTEGVGGSANKGGYLPYLKEKLEKEKGIQSAELLNFGVRGNRSSQLLDRLGKKEIAEAVSLADLLIITIGGNDMMKVVSENFSSLKVEDFEQESEHYRRNLNEIVMKVRELNPSSAIVLVGLYNPFTYWLSDIKEINKVISEWNLTSQHVLSQYEQTYYVEIANLFEENIDGLLYKDQFHPNDKGYQLLADVLFRKLDEQVLISLPEKYYTINKEEGSQ